MLSNRSHDGIHRDRHVRTVSSPEELDTLSPGPKVVLTTFPAMAMGFSRHLFVGACNWLPAVS
jgi:hypothetical protein